MTQRQQTILQILREANSYITTEAIAVQIGYSQRTVRSEMTQMKQALQALGFDALRAKTNMGYRLQLSEQEWQQLMKKLDGTSAQTLYSEAMGGKYPIIEAILKSGTVQMTRLENEVFASYKNVAQYVEQAAAWLEQRNILLRRRRGNTVDKDIIIFGLVCTEAQRALASDRNLRGRVHQGASVAAWLDRKDR